MATQTLRVPDIHCEGCLHSIGHTLGGLPGVQDVEGDAKQKIIQVEYHPEIVSLAAITHALAEAGFPVEGERARSTARQWGLGLLAILGGVVLGWFGYRLGFWGFVTSIAMPQAFAQYNLLVLSAAAGVAAFFSPCVFPLLPSYVTHDLGLHGRSGNRWARSLALGAAAALGVIAVNLAIGAVIAVLGKATPFQPDPRKDPTAILMIRTLAGVAIAGLGVLTLTGRSLPAVLLAKITPSPGANPSRGLQRLFFYGVFYNAAGIGCTGPILLSVMLFALTAGSAGAALGAFLVFSLTMGALMLGVTVLAGLSQTMLVQRLRLATPFLHRLGGVVMILVGGYTAISLATGPGREIFVRIFLPFLR
ncbi:MAG: cation transporter [Armatimonadota bacterium]